MEVLDVIKKRYAAKSFSGEKIKDEDLDKLKASILLAPSSFNWQPWKVKIIDDKDMLVKLQEVSWNQPQIGSASHLFVFCAIDSLKENNEKLIANVRENAPKEKIDMFEQMANGAVSQMDDAAQKAMSERELFMPVENLMLTATDLGYAACPVGGFETDKYKEILGIFEGLRPIVVVPVGIATDEARPKFRFDEKDVFF